MNQVTQPQFDAALYWADKPIKKFVCVVKSLDNDEKQELICGSSNSDRAAEIALENSHLKAPLICSDVRLATPDDLGALPTTLPSIKEKLHSFAVNNGLHEINLHNAGHILIGNVTAINQVNELKDQHGRLCSALADCLAIMSQCEQHKDYPKSFDNPIGSLAWDATVATARLLLKGGNQNG